MSGPSQKAREAAQALCASGWTHAIDAFARFEAEVTAPLVAENERLREERKTFSQNKRINDAMQTALERGEIWMDGDGYFKPRAALEGGCDEQG